MPWIQVWVDFMIDIRPELSEDAFLEDFELLFRATNPLIYILTAISNIKVKKMGLDMNIEPEYVERFDMKNEFYFLSVALYKEAKKNYSDRQIGREGQIIDKIANTGGNLTNTSQHPEVISRILNIIEFDIHKAKKISSMGIYLKQNEIVKMIKHELLVKKNIEFGIAVRYNGYELVKNFLTVANARAGAIFNLIYPEHYITLGGRCYMFQTSIHTEDDLYKVKDPVIRERIRSVIFNNPSKTFAPIAKYGISHIVIPADRGLEQIPDWIVDNMNVSKIVEKHLKPLTSLIPSVGINMNRIDTKTSLHSPLLELF